MTLLDLRHPLSFPPRDLSGRTMDNMLHGLLRYDIDTVRQGIFGYMGSISQAQKLHGSHPTVARQGEDPQEADFQKGGLQRTGVTPSGATAC